MTPSLRGWLSLGSMVVMMACSGNDADPGSPMAPTMTPTPTLASVTPDLLVEGSTAILHGSDFGPTPSLNTVTIDGLTATVTAASATRLSITVPVFDCRPQRMVSVQVSVGGKSSEAVDQPLEPVGLMDLGVGEMALFQEPADFCLQFPTAPAGAGEYLVGIGSAEEKPDDLLTVSMAGAAGLAAPAPSAVEGTAAPPAASAGLPPQQPGEEGGIRKPGPRAAPQWSDQSRAYPRSRHWDPDYYARARADGLRLAPGVTPDGSLRTPGALPDIGDELEFKVPGQQGSLKEMCETHSRITTVVRAVGARGIFVSDVNNPQTDALTDQEIQALSDAFDSYIYDTDTEYFGTPTDLDGNDRIFILFTVEVNKSPGGGPIAAVSPTDFFESESCPSSNVGEVYYNSVPDPDNIAGTIARSRGAIVDVLHATLAHELAHIIQISVRLRSGLGSSPPSQWEAEGQATLAMEVVGHRATGFASAQDYGAGTVFSAAGRPWYSYPLLLLSTYYGFDGGTYQGFDGRGERKPDTPETCTLFFSAANGCVFASAYGAAWSFFRFLADRYGSTWPGGEAGFMRDWNARNPTLSGVANVEALLGRPFTELFAEWAAMHYLEGRVAAADPTLLMSSWDLQDIMSDIGENAPLLPTSRAFEAFTATVSIRGGSTAYSLFTDAAPRPAVAVRVRDPQGGTLGGEMSPVLWVVRTR